MNFVEDNAVIQCQKFEHIEEKRCKKKTTVGTFKLISILGNGVCMKKKTKEHEA